MNAQSDFAAIAALDLDPIKVKLMHAQSGEGWSREKADTVEFEYRRFLYLMKKFPNDQSAPLFDVDIFWHYHILDTLKYMEDCDKVFGYYLHHFPYLGLRGEDDEEQHHHAGQRMKEVYDETFGSGAFDRAASQISGAHQGVTAWSVIAPPSVAMTAWSHSPVQIKTAWSVIAPPAMNTAWSVIAPPASSAGARNSSTLTRPTL